LGAELATPPPDASAAKGKFKSAESRRKKRIKKNAKILKNKTQMAQPVDSTEIVFLLSDCAIKKDNF